MAAQEGAFRPEDQNDLAPASSMPRLEANLAALRVLRQIQGEEREATDEERRVLARWSSWGALPNVFDPSRERTKARREKYEAAQGELRELLSEAEYSAARRTTLNAHYTDAAYVRIIWRALQALGFKGGRVLEPGSGVGTFIGMAPEGAEMTGVELDPVTAAISQALYPQARILNEGFEKSRVKPGEYDAAIGNVPFHSARLTDPRYNPGNFPMHDHFIIKALEGVRVGGVAAFITSTGTLDKSSKAARAEMGELADLVCAIRLPNGAHAAAAGTDVATDLLVFRRKAPSHKKQGAAFAKTEEVKAADDKRMDVNEYFQAHPRNVLGTLVPGRARGGKHRPEVLAGSGDTAARLDRELQREIAAAVEAGLGMTENPARREEEVQGPDARELFGENAERFDGRIIELPDGSFWSARLEDSEPHPCPKTQRDELRALLLIRDAVSELLDAETSPDADDAWLTFLRSTLNAHYEAYVQKYGPISRFTRQERTRKLTWDDVPEELSEQLMDAALEVTGRLGSKQQAAIDNLGDGVMTEADLQVLLGWNATKAPAALREALAAVQAVRDEMRDAGKLKVWARVPPNQGGFADDPHAPLVYALEDYDEETGTARKSEIFTQRVAAPRTLPEKAETPEEAAAISLDLHGKIRLDVVARLLELNSEAAARDALFGVVFEEPHTGRLVPAAEYLSGNVRLKLTQAQDAAAVDQRFVANVAALTEVQPEDVPPGEIRVKLGAPWVDASYVQEFLRGLLRDESIKVERAAGSTWTVDCRNENDVMMTAVWGTQEMNAVQIVRALLNQRPIRIVPSFPDEATAAEKAQIRAEAMTATTVANKYAEKINEEFRNWLWKDEERAEQLATLYNTRFNSFVLRNYDDAPKLSFPGLSTEFTPRPHQQAAVSRILNEPSALLAHEVGAGKTLEMSMGAMELRRLGLARKPAIVVPNHMAEQWTREFLQAYPGAKVLTASTKDLSTRRKRKRFAAKAATGDWDAIIMTYGVMKAIPLSAAEHENYIANQLADFERDLQRRRAAIIAKGEDPEKDDTVKEVEGKKLVREQALRARMRSIREGGLSWEQLGIDYLFVDEIHNFKNLYNPSNNAGLSIAGSIRATDLHMKLEYMRAKYGARVITGASATPVVNSIAEAYVWMKLLRPDILEAEGLENFDDWVANHAEIDTKIEIAPEGGLQTKSRFARFTNMPELLTAWWVPTDVKTAEDLGLPVPDVYKGGPQIISCPPTSVNAEIAEKARSRARAIRSRAVDPSEDNMLKLASWMRQAALDPRLIGYALEEGEQTKISIAADKIAELYFKHKDDVYQGPKDAAPDELPGSLQLVFADLGTPSKDALKQGKWTVYDGLFMELAARGVPTDGIRFMQEAQSDREKAALFRDARNGKISVLIGSTETMGTGTNVQRRAIAVHHLDCPWRPVDLHQRTGRVVRQKNLNYDLQREVHVYNYVTENSFDAYVWQLVLGKAKFIQQLMSGKLTDRTIEDIAMDLNEYMVEAVAMGAGDPRLQEVGTLQNEILGMEAEKHAHNAAQYGLRHTIDTETLRAEQLEASISLLTTILGDATTPGTRRSTRDTDFSMTVVGPTGTTRTYTKRKEAAAALQFRLVDAIDELRGQRNPPPLQVAELGGVPIFARLDFLDLHLDFGAGQPVPVDRKKLTADPAAVSGTIQSLEYRLAHLEDDLALAQEQHAHALAEVANAQSYLGTVYHDDDNLVEAKAKLAALMAELETEAPVQSNGPAGGVPSYAGGAEDGAVMARSGGGGGGGGRSRSRSGAGSGGAGASADGPTAADEKQEDFPHYTDRLGTWIAERLMAEALRAVVESHPDAATSPGARKLTKALAQLHEESRSLREKRLAGEVLAPTAAIVPPELWRTAIEDATKALGRNNPMATDLKRLGRLAALHEQRWTATLSSPVVLAQWEDSDEPRPDQSGAEDGREYVRLDDLGLSAKYTVGTETLAAHALLRRLMQDSPVLHAVTSEGRQLIARRRDSSRLEAVSNDARLTGLARRAAPSAPETPDAA
ncbi:SNF2-related protein, partial [Streptomyces sp. NPDC005877]